MSDNPLEEQGIFGDNIEHKILQLVTSMQAADAQFRKQVSDFITAENTLRKELFTFVVDANNLLVKIDQEVQKLLAEHDTLATKLVIKLSGGTGETGMANVQEGLIIGATAVEFNKENEQVPDPDPTKITYAVDDPTIATVANVSDDPSLAPGTARVTGVKVGTCNVTGTDASATPPLVSAPVPLNVTLDPVANSLVVSLA